jgi:hypothetical protein
VGIATLTGDVDDEEGLAVIRLHLVGLSFDGRDFDVVDTHGPFLPAFRSSSVQRYNAYREEVKGTEAEPCLRHDQGTEV